MEPFKTHVDNVMRQELKVAIDDRGCVLESAFVDELMKKHNYNRITVRNSLHRVAMEPQCNIICRRLSTELKKYYGLDDVAGCPAVFIKR